MCAYQRTNEANFGCLVKEGGLGYELREKAVSVAGACSSWGFFFRPVVGPA